MRVKRVNKFRSERRKKCRKLVFFAFFLPVFVLLASYVVTMIFIVPAFYK